MIITRVAQEVTPINIGTSPNPERILDQGQDASVGECGKHAETTQKLRRNYALGIPKHHAWEVLPSGPTIPTFWSDNFHLLVRQFPGPSCLEMLCSRQTSKGGCL